MIWKHLNQRDADELIDWTNAKLNEQRDKDQEISERFIRYGQELSDSNDRATFERALEAASAGDTTLLEIDYPELAKRFPTPGQRGRPRDDRVWEAARDVGLIRQVWKQHREFLDGKFKRSQNRTGTIEVTAEQIAADRCGVDVEAVRNRLHKRWQPPRR
jgi:hypothetical protein